MTIKHKENGNTSEAFVNDTSLRIKVRYAECDAQNVVFNARYADYADLAATEYIRALVGDYKHLLAAGIDNQVVSLHIDWHNSAQFDDCLQLKTHVSKVGNTSFCLVTLCYKELGEKELLPVATMSATYVVVDTKNYQKTPIPDFLREHFARRFSVFVDQAG